VAPHPNGGSVAVVSGLPVKALELSGLHVSKPWWLRTVIFIREADKLTLGQDVNVNIPHIVIALMNGQSHKWLTSSRLAHY
jgi:hypothetical protein